MKTICTFGFLLFISQCAHSAPMDVPEPVGDYTRAAAPTTDSFFTVFLDVNPKCNGVYDRLIWQLQQCRDGINHGDPAITTGCFLDFNLNEGDCGSNTEEVVIEENNGSRRPSSSNSVIYFPTVTETPWHPTPPCDGKYCTERGPTWSGGSPVNFGGSEGGSQGYDNAVPVSTAVPIVDDSVLIRKPVTQSPEVLVPVVTTQPAKVRTHRPERKNIIKNLLELINEKNN